VSAPGYSSIRGTELGSIDTELSDYKVPVGGGKAIEPQGFEEVHRRGNHEPHRLQRPEKWTPYGVGAIEGIAREPLPVLTAAAAGAPPKQEFAPGEEPRPGDGEPTASAHGELL